LKKKTLPKIGHLNLKTWELVVFRIHKEAPYVELKSNNKRKQQLGRKQACVSFDPK
jgi:hypothetical protein